MAYNRSAAVAYAHKWAFGRNPEFYDFSDIGGDCTNFASQVLLAGSGIMNYTPILGWYYISLNNRAPAWTGVNELYRFLTTNGGAGPKAEEVSLYDIEPGDIIQLSFNGRDFAHSPVVVETGAHTPSTVLLAAHTNDSDMRPLATYMYQEIRCLHITDIGE
jgi:hypothetical protein